MNIDDVLRDVYADLAAKAPADDQVRAGVAGRIKAHRQRRILLTAGGTVAGLAAVGVPALLWPRYEPSDVESLLAPVRWRGNPMPFGPSWLPAGYVLTERRVTTSGPGAQRRVWQLDAPMKFPEIVMRLNLEPPAPAPRATADVNGLPATVSHNAYSATCYWEPMAGVHLSVSHSDEPDDTDRGAQFAEIALQVARSVRLGNVEFVQPTISFGWLPERLPMRRVFARFYGGGAEFDVALAYSGDSGPVVHGGIGPEPFGEGINLADTQPTTLRGRPALYLPHPAEAANSRPGSFAVELGKDRWLTVSGGVSSSSPTVTKEELAHVAETFRVP